MSILAALHHRTHYVYDRPTGLGPQVVRLRPAPQCRTSIVSYSLKISPPNHFINWQQDPFGNWLARLVFPEPVNEFRIDVDLTADVAVFNPFDFFVEPSAEAFPFTYDPVTLHELDPYLHVAEDGPLLRDYVARLTASGANTVNFLVELNTILARDIEYVVRLDPGVQTPDETLTSRSGSCRDSAWLMVQILRKLGLAARFVSGYLIQLKPDVVTFADADGPSVDFCDLHAWTEVYLPGAGWIGFDTTSGLLCGEGHIPLAATPHYRSAAPISGLADPSKVDFDFHMSLERLNDSVRVSKPFQDDGWLELDALGERVDRDLTAQDVRLTMGGEPTYCSMDDFQSAEWNTDALGPTKRRQGDELLRALQARFAPHGLLQHGQGKWYPGEPLPRWAFALYWRTDGQPMWTAQSAIAKERAEGTPPPTPPSKAQIAAFASRVAEILGISSTFVLPAYEDPLHIIEQDGRRPIDFDDPTVDLSTTDSRIASLQAFDDRRLGEPVARVLPIRRWREGGGQGWVSEAWRFRRNRLFLTPGDSPAGYRLPLSSLGEPSPDEMLRLHPRDPLEARDPLPHYETLRPGMKTGVQPEGLASPPLGRSGNVRTAMVFEARDGAIGVFLPPTRTLEDFLEIAAAIETAALESQASIRIEGYGPPDDPRLQTIKVTPDPGVIEVNVHPAASWREAVNITTAVYQAAAAQRLGAEKFMIDGRHTGTGGGNHVALGGPTPQDSPFLRRPDLLKSMILYWQRHPSLSYLFSGLFVGPTSQAPRIDEARHESLYELEIAMAATPAPGAGFAPPPWLVDRLYRNLLVDVSGNTHRSEICIDKLYSPDGPTGRLGLVELRAFEMPPDARMSLAQQLLVRALVAWFWREPQSGGCVRWGTALHDRFMLPHFVWSDFLDVLDDLRRAGYDFDPVWFEAQKEFRFPTHGRVSYGSVELELRHALEPWPVMGEEGGAGGTVRFVDASVERLQVLTNGFFPDRHAIACNGRLLPMTPTGVSGQAVGGVRFKAWSMSSALHPTIPPHAPLTFDVVDRWNGRSLGGCVYHVAHPGGRNYETFPVNSYEAQARRRARFQPHGHTPGPMFFKDEASSKEFPLTLDLRRAFVR